jgi:enoyl-CoA hydratase/carnithine racemase/heme-degrading monooxygenase HmoA
MSAAVTVSAEGGILTLTLARPEKKNALTQQMYGALADQLERANDDETIKVVVLEGQGADFCAGNDLADFATRTDPAHPGNGALFIRALGRLRPVLIAAVDGWAIGVGTTMLLHCDHVLVTPEARLRAPFATLGLCPEAASSRLLPQRIGHARAFEVFTLGKTIDGALAVEWGLANRLVAKTELAQATGEVARKLAALSKAALDATKSLMRDRERIVQTMDHEHARFSVLVRSEEAQQAFARFGSKGAAASAGATGATAATSPLVDPVLELVEILVTHGREAEFETSMRAVKPIATAFPGCRSLTLSRGLENPSRFLLQIEWDSRETHTEFTRSANFPEFRAALRALVAEPPRMEHFRDIGDGPSPAHLVERVAT